jgi:hypothetical protein
MNAICIFGHERHFATFAEQSAESRLHPETCLMGYASNSAFAVVKQRRRRAAR